MGNGAMCTSYAKILCTTVTPSPSSCAPVIPFDTRIWGLWSVLSHSGVCMGFPSKVIDAPEIMAEDAV